MTNDHPITPPPELVQQWVDAYFGGKISQSNFHLDLATRAAQWGADQELEACCELTRDNDGYDAALALRAARRPKSPSLKEQALEAARIELDPKGKNGSLILRALEALPD
jgi:hypothetical protein